MTLTAEQTAQLVAIAGMVLGVISRTLLPFLMCLRDNPDTHFDRKFLVPAIVSVVLNLAALPLVVGVASVPTSFIGGYISGWGTQDITRQLIVLAAPKVGLSGLV